MQTIDINFFTSTAPASVNSTENVKSSYGNDVKETTFFDLIKSADSGKNPEITTKAEGTKEKTGNVNPNEPEAQKSTEEKSVSDRQKTSKSKETESKSEDQKGKTEKTDRTKKTSENEQKLTALNEEKPALFANENAFIEKLSENAEMPELNEVQLAVNLSENEQVKVEISPEQLEFLKINENIENSVDALIENAEEYFFAKTDKDLIKNAQNLSLENPKQFLNEALIAGENKDALSPSKYIIESKLTSENKNVKTNIKATVKKSAVQEKNKITVTDLRGSDSNEAAEKVKKDHFKVNISEPKNNSIDMTLTMENDARQNILSLNNQTAGAQGSNYQAMLSQQIQENVPEFVKAGNIVLKDSNNGTINMILKPENLGNVKVSLQLSDKVITGQIIVNSQEAYDAFKENIDALKQAFQQNGFESSSFNLSFANSNSQSFSQGQNQNQNNFAENLGAQRVYGDLVYAGESSQSVNSSAFYNSSSEYQIDYIA